MSGLIDYAGLFPPAKLDMSSAVRTFGRHLDSEFSWMLGCFVCPVSRLTEFAAECSAVERHVPVSMSVLGTGLDTEAGLAETARADASVVTQVEREGSMRPLQLEVKWPRSLISTDALNRYSEALSGSGCRYERLFFEIDRTHDWERDVVEMAEALAAADGQPGFKIRTGGVTADLYPDTDAVVSAILACRDAGVPLKATAGLHHPMRHRRASPDVDEHGFFNLFGAAALAHADLIDRPTLAAVIEDDRLSNFEFGADGFRWREAVLSVEDLRAARSELAFSFGSCSFDEPLDDLADAGLL